MGDKSRFVIIDHFAKKAGKHQDLRFKKPGSTAWYSFAVRKGVPTEVGQKVLAVKTNMHSEKDALFTGRFERGYGAGEFKKFDEGECIVEKFTTAHIVITIKGSKIKGRYHFISIKVIGSGRDKYTEYMLFKGKEEEEEK